MGWISLPSQKKLSMAGILLILFWMGLESQAWARAGGGKSSGTRGYRSGSTYQRSPSQSPSAPQSPKNFQQPTSPQSPSPIGSGRSGGFFTGFTGGLMGGIIGGMLFRSLGFAGSGDWGGGFGLVDLFFILLLLGAIYYLVKHFRSRPALQMSAAAAGSVAYPFPEPRSGLPPQFPDSFEYPISKKEIPGLRHIQAMDPTFEEGKFLEWVKSFFCQIQTHFSNRNLDALRPLLTPEMYAALGQQIHELIQMGERNHLEKISIGEVKIVDAGQDHGEEYIRVRISASLLDYGVDERSGRIISGSDKLPVNFSESWTFSRNVGERGEQSWVLSGIHPEEDE